MAKGRHPVSVQVRPRRSQIPGIPISTAAAMSASGLSPTSHPSVTSVPARRAAASKMRRSGLLTPSSSEMTTTSTTESSPHLSTLVR